MGEDYGTLLDAIMPPAGESFPPYLPEEEGQEKVVSPTRNGTANGTASHEVGAPGSPSKVETYGMTLEEETDNRLDGAPDVPKETLNQESNGLENLSTLPAAVHVPGEESSETLSQKMEHDSVVQTHESTQQEEEAPPFIVEEPHDEAMQADEAPAVVIEQTHDEAMQEGDEASVLINEQAHDSATRGAEEAPALIVEKQEEVQVQDVMDVLKQDEIPVTSVDEQQKPQEADSAQGGDLAKQEVAHRSHVLGSLSKLDENSARQLLNDYGWNVSQSVRMNGKTQWYYRSPPPKPVLVGSLTSAVALWKKLVDDDHKRKGGGEDDLYPMVTAFLNNMKRPSGKKRKRGRYSE